MVKLGQHEKLILSILSGTRDNQIAFSDISKLLSLLGFQCRIKGSHHIYYRDGVEEILNLQAKGKQAKAYQVKQVRAIILKYKLELTDDV